MNETDTLEAESQEREENAGKARETADRLFPGHEWRKVEDGIYLSPRRPIGKKSHYETELQNARILRDSGDTVYLAPERKDSAEKQADAIVSGQLFEFKNVGGNANTLAALFLRSRSQAPNVFINLENSDLTRREIMTALRGARHSKTHTNRKGDTLSGYTDINQFDDGKVVLKLKGQENLVYLNVNDL